MLESTCSTSESEIIFNLFMLTVNDSIRIKRNDISKKETKKQKSNFFEKYQKISKSQVTWPHNGLKYFFRFFRLRMTQFEKINEKKISKILKFLKKFLSLRSRDLIRGNFGSKFFYCIFWIRMAQFVKKSKKNFFSSFWP